ncbi:hypothetical protein G9C98_002084 [Cotesia typhae]|uniref:Uncharacterized protein n=1 Tax=Cotesia typhae TaxID=2053667 RepID=A0A8J5QY08_9HYME|nr:hypothetical protein G9C98_002084 [Cotesia typhae]
MYDSKKRKLAVRRSSVSMSMVSQYIHQEKSYGITLSVKIHRGRREMSGIIGYKNWHVSPMPERLRRSLNQSRSNRSIDDEIDSDDEDKSYHIISQLPNTDGQNLMAPLLSVQRSGRSAEQRKVAYIEILVIVDFNFFKLMNFDMNKTIIYVLANWNSVDTLYRDFEHPKIKISIAGIIVAQNEKALSYIQSDSQDRIDVSVTLDGMSAWLYEHRNILQISNYDAAFRMITHYHLNFVNDDGVWEPGTAGFSHGSAICKFREDIKSE